MAEITNTQAVRFANERARVIADLIEKLDRTIPQFMLDVVQLFENNTGGNANEDAITDGSASDGRNPVTKYNVGELKYVVEQIKACLDTDDRRAVVHKWAVNGAPAY